MSNFTDEYGQPMSSDIIREIKVPRQIPSEVEAVTIEKSGEKA